MGFLKNFLSSLSPSTTNEQEDANFSQNITDIEKLLDDLPPERARYLASFALVLGRIAYADCDVSPDEERKIFQLLKDDFELPEGQAEAVARLCVEKAIHHSLENHLVIRALKETADHHSKLQIIRALFSVAAFEDISGIENAEIRVIAESLGLSHSEFISLRSEFRDHLSFLRTKSPN